VNLVELSLAIEERILGDHLEKDTAVAPDVHFGVVVAVSHETLRCPVPSGGDVLSVGLLGINT